MPWFYICLICCNEIEALEYIFDTNFLWNDGLYQAKPVCHDCIFDFYGNHLNYEPIRIRKKEGLEKWL
ncbi:hypothetical protein LCGC14_1031170 [marine sediment metagenome]|uniref:Uncharacterized protein n=1 Tax=marine sediment metagenome TaxID=412755 RepID=A0A0F9R0H0_9ZZZZ